MVSYSENRGELVLVYCVLLCVNLIQSQAEWFGPTKEYKCQCDTGCNLDGTCSNNGKCLRGWFGLKCQYNDLVTLNGTTSSSDITRLKDRDDQTCMESKSSDLVISFNRTFVFTWLRIVVNNESILPNFTVQFKTNDSQEILQCRQMRLHLVEPRILDIRCNLTVAIQHVIINATVLNCLCSLYINGGRNVALKQSTWQSSTYSYDDFAFDSSNAVDGDTSANFMKNSCTHTDVPDFAPVWRVRFRPSQITRYVLYNRDSDRERLQGFILEANGNVNEFFTYRDTSTSVSSIYTVIDSNKRIITDVLIRTYKIILTLCEVEIYGECASGTWGLDCQKCPAHCSDTCHIEDGSCNMVCLGFSNPLDCNKDCSPGQWGINCNLTCNYNCRDTHCDKNNGRCINGCISGFQPPDCNKGCYDGFWGENCTQICKNNCYNKTCDKVNGFCSEGCISGFKPPSCIEDCDKGNYGINCEQTCPSYCIENECNPISGFCKNSSHADKEPFHKEEKNSGTGFGAGFGAGVGSAAVLFAIVLLLLYWLYKKKMFVLHKQSERQHTYNQPDSLQLEKHVYETAATEVHYNII